MPIIGITMPRAMFWIGFLYVFIATIVAFWIGRPIIRLSFDNEKYNAAFRYALVRLRDASEAVAFYRGEVGRTPAVAAAVRPDRVQLQALHQPDDGIQRLEPVDQPDHRAAALAAAGAAAVRPADQVRRRHPVRVGVQFGPGRAVVLPQPVRQLRRLAGVDHASARTRRLQRGGPGAAEAGQSPTAGSASSNSTTSRSARRTASS